MRKRTLIALGILLFGAGFTFWLIYTPSKKVDAFGVTITTSDSKDIRFAERNDSDISNRTEDALKQYGTEIFKLNPKGQGTDKPLNLPPDGTLEQIVNDAATRPVSLKLFTTADITTNGHATKESSRQYLSAVTSIENQHNTYYPNYYAIVSRFVINGDTREPNLLMNELSDNVSALRAVPVPEEWADFHVDFINLLNKRLEYAKKLLDVEDDPVMAAAATKDLKALLQEEDALVNAKLGQLVKKYIQS